MPLKYLSIIRNRSVKAVLPRWAGKRYNVAVLLFPVTIFECRTDKNVRLDRLRLTFYEHCLYDVKVCVAQIDFHNYKMKDVNK